MKTKNIFKGKPIWFAFLFITVCFTLSARLIDLPQNFTNLLTRAQMSFDKPNGSEETAIIKNSQMSYDYAVKFPGHNFEVRYAVRPLDSLIKQFEAMKKDPGMVMSNIGPNKYYPMSFQAILLNISGGRLGRGAIKAFPPEAVKKEFNADWGATCMVPLAKEFGQDYKACMVIALHKDNVGDAYCFYMINDQEDVKMMPSILHVLKFK